MPRILMVWPPDLPTPEPVSTPSMLLRISAMEVARTCSISSRGSTLIEAGAWVIRCSKPAAVTTTSATLYAGSAAVAPSSARADPPPPPTVIRAVAANRDERRDRRKQNMGRPSRLTTPLNIIIGGLARDYANGSHLLVVATRLGGPCARVQRSGHGHHRHPDHHRRGGSRDHL